MKAGLGRFLLLWLPVVAALLLGLARAWTTGQADPWDWAVPVALLLTVTGFLLARSGWLVSGWVGLGAAGTALIFCTIAAARAPNPVAAAGLGAVALLAELGGAGLRVRRWFVAAGSLTVVGLLLWRGPALPIAPAGDFPALAVITGLPLFWDEAGKGMEGPRDAPIITVLRTRFTVHPVDDPRALAASGARRLLLAQPRALSPEQLVAIDRWVRDGGTALVLADPLLRWPSPLPLGDRRRAPPVGLLGPLLAHWGVVDDRSIGGEVRYFRPEGGLVTLSDSALFRRDGQPSLPLSVAVGRGRALIVGDADLLDDRLWLADPARPLDPRAWSADTPALVAQWLGAAMPGGRRWLRQAEDVWSALRWTLLAGTGWAMMGVMMQWRISGQSASGTNRENMLEQR